MINIIRDLDGQIQLEGMLFHMWKPSFTWLQTSGLWNCGTSLYIDIKTKYTKDLWREKWQMGSWRKMSFELLCWPGCNRRNVSFWILQVLSKQQGVCMTKIETVLLESTLLYKLQWFGLIWVYLYNKIARIYSKLPFSVCIGVFHNICWILTRFVPHLHDNGSLNLLLYIYETSKDSNWMFTFYCFQ